MTRSVTLLINSLRTGGAERVCATLANELHTSGWDVTVLVLNLRDASIHDELNPAVRTVDLRVRHVRQSAIAIMRHIIQHRPTTFLVFNHQLAVLLVWLRLLGVGRFRIVARNINTLSVRRQHECSLWHRFAVNALTRAFYNRVDAIVAQSAGMKADLLAHYGVDGNRVVVIHNPLSPRFSCASVEALVPWESRGREILYVGRLSAAKDLDLLIDSCAICMVRDPSLGLRLVGTGDRQALLQRRAAALEVDDRVVFEGLVHDPVHLYRQAKVVVLTSHYEGFPNVLIEAISQGTPIVAVDCPSGPAEIVREGVNGVLIRDRSPHSVAAAIEYVLHGKWDVGRVRQTAARFSRVEITREYEAILTGEHSR